MSSVSQYALMTWLSRGFTETQSLSNPHPRVKQRWQVQPPI